VDPIIQSLVRFQELNLEAARLSARLSQIPSELKSVDDEQQAAASSVARARDSLAEAGKRRRDLERQLQDFEGKISKYNDQSRDVKTNEQYRAIMSEIQTVRVHIGEVEEKILLAMEESDVLERRIKEEEKVVASRKGEFDARRAKLAAERDHVTAERDRIKEEASTRAGTIPPEALDIFNTIAGIRSGVAMARAREERCTGCNVRIRPQVFADVRKNSQVIQCESCKRILYYIEEQPQPGAVPAAAAAEAGAPPAGEDSSPANDRA
jgi:predicted  nucleic acid-binding Zn-ribbon protein